MFGFCQGKQDERIGRSKYKLRESKSGVVYQTVATEYHSLASYSYMNDQLCMTFDAKYMNGVSRNRA
jgi:hypothetical protein